MDSTVPQLGGLIAELKNNLSLGITESTVLFGSNNALFRFQDVVGRIKRIRFFGGFMSKSAKLSQNETDCTEIIELAIEDVEMLTRAFNLITEICEQVDDPSVSLLNGPAKDRIN